MSKENTQKQISGNIIKQIFLILTIMVLVGLICYNLSMFLPSLLGALTLYIVSRSFNLYLQEKKKWKSHWAALSIIGLCLIIIILPSYFMVDYLVAKLGNTDQYMPKFQMFTDKVRDYLMQEFNFDILSKANTDKLKTYAGQLSTGILNGTVNLVTIIFSMFFILYFLLIKPRVFERALTNAAPLKRANINLIGEKFRRLVIANAVGIPVVALGQALVGVIGYFIFGAPSPMLLFVFTFVGSMIPVVGAAIVYIPVGIFMIAEGDTFGGVGILIYSSIAVGLTDNVLRFTLLKKLEDIHPLNTVFGIIMGINLFGFMGLIFGPILVSITGLLIRVYNNEYGNTSSDLILEHKSGREVEQEQNTKLIL